MENIRRKIKVFFADYGFLLIEISIIIIIISSILRSLNNQVKKDNRK